ncbi:MAG: chorismate mutase [Alphaproteobacteria bacterium]|nr:chorismate mutase [Alphaproteobacteria bacterium]
MTAMKTHEADHDVVAAGDCASMADVRREIDRVDRALVRLLAERLTYIERAGHIKPVRSAVRDEDRIRDVLAKVRATCQQEGFPYTIAEPVWRQLMEGCIAHEFVVFDERREACAKAASA